MSQVLCSIKYVPKYGQILPKAVFGTHIWALLCFILWVRHLYRFSNVKSIGHCEWIWEYFFHYCPILSWSKYHNIIKIMKIGNFITTSRNLSLSPGQRRGVLTQIQADINMMTRMFSVKNIIFMWGLNEYWKLKHVYFHVRFFVNSRTQFQERLNLLHITFVRHTLWFLVLFWDHFEPDVIFSFILPFQPPCNQGHMLGNGLCQNWINSG